MISGKSFLDKLNQSSSHTFLHDQHVWGPVRSRTNQVKVHPNQESEGHTWSISTQWPGLLVWFVTASQGTEQGNKKFYRFTSTLHIHHIHRYRYYIHLQRVTEFVQRRGVLKSVWYRSQVSKEDTPGILGTGTGKQEDSVSTRHTGLW